MGFRWNFFLGLFFRLCLRRLRVMFFTMIECCCWVRKFSWVVILLWWLIRFWIYWGKVFLRFVFSFFFCSRNGGWGYLKATCWGSVSNELIMELRIVGSLFCEWVGILLISWFDAGLEAYSFLVFFCLMLIFCMLSLLFFVE